MRQGNRERSVAQGSASPRSRLWVSHGPACSRSATESGRGHRSRPTPGGPPSSGCSRSWSPSRIPAPAGRKTNADRGGLALAPAESTSTSASGAPGGPPSSCGVWNVDCGRPGPARRKRRRRCRFDRAEARRCSLAPDLPAAQHGAGPGDSGCTAMSPLERDPGRRRVPPSRAIHPAPGRGRSGSPARCSMVLATRASWPAGSCAWRSRVSLRGASARRARPRRPPSLDRLPSFARAALAGERAAGAAGRSARASLGLGLGLLAIARRSTEAARQKASRSWPRRAQSVLAGAYPVAGLCGR